LDQYEEALVYYEQIQQLEPANFLAYYNAGQAYKNLQNYLMAETQYLKALKYNENDLVVLQALDELYRYHMPERADYLRGFYADAIVRYPDRPEFKQALDAFNQFMANKK
jgi:tetratricopeptide (TPR) repeat protein